MCSFRSTLLLCLLPLTALAGEELPVTSTIQEVKVFLNGAQIARSASHLAGRPCTPEVPCEANPRGAVLAAAWVNMRFPY